MEKEVWILLKNGELAENCNFCYTDKSYAKGLAKQYNEHIHQKQNGVEYKAVQAKLTY